MCKETSQRSRSAWVFFSLMIGFLVACGPSQAELDATDTQLAAIEQAAQTAAAPTATNLPPSATPTPQATPTPTRKEQVEQVTIPDCIEEETEDETIFHELLASFSPELSEMESFQYRTIYSYKENDLYSEDELSIEILGAHSGLLSEPGGGNLRFYPLASQMYENSHIIQTDLRNDEQTELIVNQQGFLVRESNDSGWINFDQFLPGDLLYSTEMLSPREIIFMLTGGGGLTPGIWTETPLMAQQETLDHVEVMHRCWILEERSEDIDGYLIHYDSVYTFLKDVEVHLWTAENDTRLMRLAITGKHNEERLSENDFLEHDTTRDFLLWVDLYDVGNKIEIEDPSEAAITFTVPSSDIKPEVVIAAPHNELPLPEDAETSDMNLLSEGYESPIPREYLWPHYESTVNALEAFAGSNWYDIPDDRLPSYKTNLNLSNVLAFYTEEMEKRGWNLDNVFYQIDWSRLFLNFGHDQVSFLVILEEDEAGITYISAIVPPGEEILTSLIDGWKTYSQANSGLLSDEVITIAHDGQGEVWIGSETIEKEWTLSSDGTTREYPEVEGGISIYDGKSWTNLTTSNSELESNDIWSIKIDRDGRTWISFRGGLSVFDGERWNTYTEEDYDLGLIQVIKSDPDGNIWVSDRKSISVFNGHVWKTISHLYSILAFDFDQQGRLWIGTNGGGIYSQDGENWIEHVVPEGEPFSFGRNDIEDLSFDSGGNLWIIDGVQGVSVFDGELWTNFDPENTGLSLNYVQELQIDQFDRVWLVTIGGSVFMRDTNGEWSDFSPNPIGISIDYPRVLNVDHEGRIWVGSRYGIAVFTPPEP